MISTLANKLNQSTLQRDQSGQLTQQSPVGLQTLSGQMGLQSPPLTPLGASGVGANPDQSKMAGTPAQKNAALTQATQPGQSLQDTLRRNQGNERTAATGAESQAMQKSQDLQNLGGLGDRVASFIDAQRQKLDAAAQAATPVQVQAAGTITGAQGQAVDPSSIKDILAQLRADPTNQQLQLQVNQALGYDAKQQLSPDQINGLYQSSIDAISKGGNADVAKSLTVEDLTAMPNFGYDKAELAHLLGVPEDQVGQMNIANIRDKINQIQSDEFSTTSKLGQQAQSGELGGAERALAQSGAREASRVGIRSSEADIQHLDQQIQNADQVQFGGKQYSVEDLLKDGTVSGVISDYLNSAPGSAERTQLDKTEPQLSSFISKNQALLQDASDQLSKGAQTFQNTQAANQQLASQLPANLAKAVLPEAGQLSATQVDPSTRPVLQYIQQNPDAARLMQGMDDQDAQSVASLSADQLKQLFSNGGAQWQQYQQDKQTVQAATSKLQTDAKNPDALVQDVFQGKGPANYAQFQQQFNQEKALQSLGLPNNMGQFSGFDNGKGQPDSPDQLAAMVRNNASGLTLDQALQGNRRQTGDIYLPPPQASDVAHMEPWQQALAQNAGNILQGGGFNAQAVVSAVQGLSDADIQKASDSIKNNAVSSALADVLRQRHGGTGSAATFQKPNAPAAAAQAPAPGQKLSQAEFNSLSKYDQSRMRLSNPTLYGSY